MCSLTRPAQDHAPKPIPASAEQPLGDSRVSPRFPTLMQGLRHAGMALCLLPLIASAAKLDEELLSNGNWQASTDPWWAAAASLKIEDGMGRGETIYHAINTRTEEEREALKKRFLEREETRKRNREIQEANVRRKEEAAQDKLLARRAKYAEENEQDKDQAGEEDEGNEIEDKSEFSGGEADFEEADEFSQPTSARQSKAKPSKSNKQKDTKRVKTR